MVSHSSHPERPYSRRPASRSAWRTPCKVGLFCLFGSAAFWVIGLLGAGASLAGAFSAADTSDGGQVERAQTLAAWLSSAQAFTWLGLGVAVLLLLAALAAFCRAAMRWLDGKEQEAQRLRS